MTKVIRTSGSFYRTDDDSVRTSANFFKRLTNGSKQNSEEEVVKVSFSVQGHIFSLYIFIVLE